MGAVEAYGAAVLNERSPREGFHRFQNGKFNIKDKEGSERVKMYEIAELKTL